MTYYKLITLQFAGGCELLFDKKTELRLEAQVPVGCNLSELVQLIKERHIRERPDLFVDTTGTTIRPGILVLVNGCDAEVVGGMTDYVLEEGDTVEFISTLHGG